MEVVKHETCLEYFRRRLREGWKCLRLEGYNAVLLSPDGIVKQLDLRNDVETLRPNAPGDVAELTPYPGIGEANWENVDEAEADDASTYNYIGGLYTYTDLYNVADPTFDDGATINNVTVYWRCRNAGASFVKGYYGIKSGVTESWSNLTTFGGSYDNYNTVYTTDPNTSVAWTKAAITALQVGVKIISADDAGISVTQIYVVVDYTPAAVAKKPTFMLDSKPRTRARFYPSLEL